MPALTQDEVNYLMDFRHRGQGTGARTEWRIGLFTVLPTRTTSGTELSTGAGYTGYARIVRTSSMTNWSGTQSDGSTTASSGTRDYISNNVAIQFSASLAAAWPNVVGSGLWDSGGVLREWQRLVDSDGNPITRSWAIGDSVNFAAGTFRLYIR